MKQPALACLMLLTGATHALDAKNPFLADSPWPISHHDSQASDTSSVPGPTSAAQLGAPSFVFTGFTNVTQAISPRYPDGSYVYWGSNSSNVYKLATRNGKLVKLADMSKPGSPISIKNPTNGAYTLVDLENIFYTVKGTRILAYTDKVRGNPASPIMLLRELSLSSKVSLKADDSVVGLNLTWDGKLVFATKYGIVGVVDRAFTTVSSLDLNKNNIKEEDQEQVSNSISTDASGGIYVVTSKKMHRVQWTGAAVTQNPASGAWTADYNFGTGDTVNGGLGAGSGSTPTVMGEGSQQFIVITDGAKVNNLVLFWKDAIPADWKNPIAPGKDIRIAAEIPVNFGNPNRKSTYSEQSVVVNGYGAVVVSNDYRNLNFLPSGTGNPLIDNITTGISAFFSGLPLFQPWGVQKFEWNPQTRKLSSAWVNNDVSCPNAIPTASSTAGMFYCVGARDRQWTIEGLDWDNGQSRFRKYVGLLPRFNSFYAATQIAADGGIIYGSIDGVVYLPRR